MPEKVEEFKMITTRRSIGDSMVSEQRSVSGGIGLLERRAEAPAEDIFTSIPTANAAPVTSYAATSAAAAPAPAAPAYSAPEEDVYELAPEKDETDEEARLRMQRNLNRLLNYDRVEEEPAPAAVETVEAVAAPAAPVQEEVPFVETVAMEEEDIRPTSTTMQFGDGETDGVYNDMARTREEAKESYKLNAKGKIIVALYALAVTVILSLIIINTGVLASIKNGNNSLRAEISGLTAESEALAGRIETVSSDEYVINVAENEYNMIKGN